MGDALCFAAELFFSCYLVFFKGLIGRYSPFTVMKWMFTWSVLCIVPFTYDDVAAVQFAELPAGVVVGISLSELHADYFRLSCTAIPS